MRKRLKTDIINYLAAAGENSSLLMTRGEEEIKVLKEWLAHSACDEKNSKHVAASSLDTIREKINLCRACGDTVERKLPFGTGTSGVMVILHSPRLVDRVEKKILKAESVETLKKMLVAIGLDMRECYITNMIKCEPGNVFTRPSEMMSNCFEILREELAVVKPKMVFVMGEMQPLQKIVHESRGIIWYAFEHPITLIKNPEMKRAAWNTLKTAAAERDKL